MLTYPSAYLKFHNSWLDFGLIRRKNPSKVTKLAAKPGAWRSRKMHVIWTNSLDSMVIAGMKATVILLKTALEETVPRLHVPHHQIKIGV
jgi:hypothetical protein